MAGNGQGSDSQGSQDSDSSSSGSGRGSNLTTEDRRRGGQNSGGNFANDPERASEAGRKGGQS